MSSTLRWSHRFDVHADGHVRERTHHGVPTVRKADGGAVDAIGLAGRRHHDPQRLRLPVRLLRNGVAQQRPAGEILRAAPGQHRAREALPIFSGHKRGDRAVGQRAPIRVVEMDAGRARPGARSGIGGRRPQAGAWHAHDKPPSIEMTCRVTYAASVGHQYATSGGHLRRCAQAASRNQLQDSFLAASSSSTLSIKPGATQLTVILRFASSSASAFVAPMTPAFAAL